MALAIAEKVVGRELNSADQSKLVDNFIDAEFEGGKHQKRVDLITAIEQNNL